MGMLSQARELLKAEEPLNWLESEIYETEPWGELAQAKFLNQAVGFQSNKTPHELLKLCKSIEKKMGRQIREKWKEREIDLDLLYCGDCIAKDETLTLPHPYISQREFVLMPLCDIAPDFIDPQTGVSVREMLIKIMPNFSILP
jgi:2-amino-4-hydroxy-6-hydroxymethyldihydropteridine diphosphokinase